MLRISRITSRSSAISINNINGRLVAAASSSTRPSVASVAVASVSAAALVSSTLHQPFISSYLQHQHHRSFTSSTSLFAPDKSSSSSSLSSYLSHAQPWLDHRPITPNFSHTLRNAHKSNIILMGPPGSGKTSVARVLSKSLNLPLIDVDDDVLEPTWRTSVAAKLKELGDTKFVEAEGEAVKQMRVEGSIIALSGSNPLHPSSLEHLAKDGVIFYLDIDPQEILNRCERMKVDRIVGQATTTLANILAYRKSIYENSYDVRVIISAGEKVEEIAERIRKVVERKRMKQKYVSTRGYNNDKAAASSSSSSLDFLDVVQMGLSPDRGLFVPSALHGLEFTHGELTRMSHEKLRYEEIALRVIERFPLGDRIHTSELRKILYRAYSTFEEPQNVLPITKLNVKKSASNFHSAMYLMETYHGPTASFKDLSLQLLPQLMSHIQSKTPPEARERVGLLVATSGDTGTAALDGFSRQKDVPVIVLYPFTGVSLIQKAQMQTTPGKEVMVLGVKDTDFDFCQGLVKDIFNDKKLNEEFRSLLPHFHLSSANSMNWGRFLPQIVFSVSSYIQLLQTQQLRVGDAMNLVVPTGNFGNILGAIYAKLILGLPIKRVICASNTNNILYDFIRTGTYDMRKQRFIYLLSDGDDVLVKKLFTELSNEGHFTISPQLVKKMHDVVGLEAGWCSEEECLATIKKTYDTTGTLIDPHTAVAVHVANQLLTKSDPQTPVVVSSTAHWAKFPNAMCRAFDHTVPKEDEEDLQKMMQHLEKIAPEAYRKTMHTQLQQLIRKPKLHDKQCRPNKEEIVNEIKKFLKSCR